MKCNFIVYKTAFRKNEARSVSWGVIFPRNNKSCSCCEYQIDKEYISKGFPYEERDVYRGVGKLCE